MDTLNFLEHTRQKNSILLHQFKPYLIFSCLLLLHVPRGRFTAVRPLLADKQSVAFRDCFPDMIREGREFYKVYGIRHEFIFVQNCCKSAGLHTRRIYGFTIKLYTKSSTLTQCLSENKPYAWLHFIPRPNSLKEVPSEHTWQNGR